MTRMTLLGVLAIAALPGCNNDLPQDAQRTADRLTGDAKGAAADNPICKLFRPDEVAAYIGEPVDAGGNAGMGTGCQWAAKDGEGDVMVVAIPSDYAEQPSLAEGYKEAPEAGEKGFVVPEMGGWAAGAIAGDRFIKVSVAGAKADGTKALALLKESIKRHPG